MSDTRTRPACPICSRPMTPEHRPFCSRRCADVDLGRWFSGDYRVPGPPVDPEDPQLREHDANRRGRLDPEDGLG